MTLKKTHPSIIALILISVIGYLIHFTPDNQLGMWSKILISTGITGLVLLAWSFYAQKPIYNGNTEDIYPKWLYGVCTVAAGILCAIAYMLFTK